MEVDIDEVLLVSETSLTVRGTRRRTTVPKGVIDLLQLEDKDRLRWFVQTDGLVIVQKVEGDIP